MSDLDHSTTRSTPEARAMGQADAMVYMAPSLPGVAAGYRHHDRLVTPGTDISHRRVYLKWYDLRTVGTEVPSDIDRAAREAVEREIASGLGVVDASDTGDETLGLVVLHVSDPITYLIIGTWRGNQELWTTTMIRQTAGGDFAVVSSGSHVPALCVWEMAPVWHERQAWVRYLRFPRDAADRAAFLADRLDGLV